MLAFNHSNKFQRNVCSLCIICPHKLSSIFLLSPESISSMLFISLNVISLIYCIFMLLFMSHFIEFMLSCILWFQIKFLQNFSSLAFSEYVSNIWVLSISWGYYLSSPILLFFPNHVLLEKKKWFYNEVVWDILGWKSYISLL